MAKGHDEPKTWEQHKRRILGLLDTFDEQAIADLTGLSVGDVRRAIREAPSRPKWWARNNKTGATVTGTERGVYRRAQLYGWTDWDCGMAG